MVKYSASADILIYVVNFFLLNKVFGIGLLGILIGTTSTTRGVQKYIAIYFPWFSEY